MSQSFSISFAFNSSWNSQNRKTLCPNVSRLQTQSVNGNGIERYFQKWKEWLWKGSKGYCLHHCIGLNPSLNYYAQEMILTPRMSCKIGRKPSSQVATILVLEMNPLLLKTSCCLLLVSKWCSGELLHKHWESCHSQVTAWMLVMFLLYLFLFLLSFERFVLCVDVLVLRTLQPIDLIFVK